LFPAAARTDRLATIRDVNQRYGVTIDTHTADGVKVAREHLAGRADGGAGNRAAGQVRRHHPRSPGPRAERPAAFDGIEKLPQRFDAGRRRQVKAYIAQHTGL
jgi:threonine synthase